MSDLTVQTATSVRLRDLMTASVLIATALFVLYAVFVNQGEMLHELAHDGRHLFAAQCH